MKGDITMNRGTKSVVLVALLIAMGSVAVGQESLKDIVEEQGLGWMAGQWKASTDDGLEISVGFQWGANGHALVHDLTMGERSSNGIIYLVADEEQVKEFGVDSRGKVTQATWESQDGKAICKTKWTDEYGDSTDVGFAYSKVDSKTMKVEVYTLENGELSWDPAFEINFNRQKKK
jgi:hypothetical protein